MATPDPVRAFLQSANATRVSPHPLNGSRVASQPLDVPCAASQPWSPQVRPSVRGVQRRPLQPLHTLGAQLLAGGVLRRRPALVLVAPLEVRARDVRRVEVVLLDERALAPQLGVELVVVQHALRRAHQDHVLLGAADPGDGAVEGQHSRGEAALLRHHVRHLRGQHALGVRGHRGHHAAGVAPRHVQQGGPRVLVDGETGRAALAALEHVHSGGVGGAQEEVSVHRVGREGQRVHGHVAGDAAPELKQAVGGSLLGIDGKHPHHGAFDGGSGQFVHLVIEGHALDSGVVCLDALH